MLAVGQRMHAAYAAAHQVQLSGPSAAMQRLSICPSGTQGMSALLCSLQDHLCPRHMCQHSLACASTQPHCAST